MKFGKILRDNAINGWTYINYRGLKDIILCLLQESNSGSSTAGSTWFEKALMNDILDVNSFFESIKKLVISESKINKNYPLYQKLKELHKYAVINYLAVLKILKKHDKHFTPIRPKIVDFFTKLPLYKAINTPSLFEGCDTRENPSCVQAPDCPICLEPCLTPVSLTCGHEFCWICLWKGDMENHIACPLCRKSQTLNPCEMNIKDILGGFSDKYYPRQVDNKVHLCQTAVPNADEEDHAGEEDLEIECITEKLARCGTEKTREETRSESFFAKTKAIGDPLMKFSQDIGSITHLRHGLHKDLVFEPYTPCKNSLSTLPRKDCCPVPSITNSAQTPETDSNSEDDCMFDLEM